MRCMVLLVCIIPGTLARSALLLLYVRVLTCVHYIDYVHRAQQRVVICDYVYYSGIYQVDVSDSATAVSGVR